MDLTASILAATGTAVSPEARLEGMNLLPMLSGQSPVERTLFGRIDVPARQERAVRQGEWRLLQDGDDLLLYNLRADVGERQDLAGQRPELVAALLPQLRQWESEVDAEAKQRNRP